MTDLSGALSSNNLNLMILTAATLGFLHTIVGPDHYIPFVMMSKAQKWSNTRTFLVTFLCGVGHVLSSIFIGIILIGLGTAASQWDTGFWGQLHEWRGSIAAWLLIGLGAFFFIRGIIRTWRGVSHTHHHVHADGTSHSHEHIHELETDHSHVHNNVSENTITPWLLFTIFVFGPCESLIPLMLAAWAVSGFIGVFGVSIAFMLTTIATILISVWAIKVGIDKLPIAAIEKHAESLAGFSLVLCGVAIEFLGL